MECCFCEEYLHPLNNPYYNEIGKRIGQPSRIVAETDHWYVIPSFGCLTVGYLLLVCKQHYLSAANLSREWYEEMLELKDSMERILYQKLGLKCLVFEHGTTSLAYSGANSVDHVHLHLVPFAGKIWPDISQKYGLTDFVTAASYRELFSLWSQHLPHSYLLFQDTDQTIYYRPDAQGFPSQLFRQCLAPYFQAEQWNWKQEVYPENLLKTIELFR